MNTVLVVAAHPDDEILGCGGTMARHIADGDMVHVLIVAEGATSRDTVRNQSGRSDELSALKDAGLRAASVIGCKAPVFLGLPDNRLDSLDLIDVIKPIESVMAEIKPNIVYTHHGGDMNIDHVIVNRAVLTACRPIPGATVTSLFTFEVPSSTDWGAAVSPRMFHPVRFVNISKSLEQKNSALECYESEMREFPHARSYRSVKSLAVHRGTMCGVEVAEAFEVVRQLVD
jgi:N-acetylglucosamine malate deacetylase 1